MHQHAYPALHTNVSAHAKIAWLLVLWCTALVVPAQAGQTDNYIQTRGEGRVQLLLNRVEITYSFTALKKNLEPARQSVFDRHRAVLKSLAQLGVEKRQIDDSHLTIAPVYEWRDNQKTFTGVSYTRSTTIRDLAPDTVGQIIARLVKNQVDRLDQPELYSNQLDQAKNTALELATTNALDKARLMASKAGARLGNIISLQEGDSQQPGPLLAQSRVMATNTAPQVNPITATTTTIRQSVNLRIQILPMP